MEIYTNTIYEPLISQSKPILQQFGAKQFKFGPTFEWTAVAPGYFGAGSWMMRGAFSLLSLNSQPHLLTLTSLENL